jgi:hypothetical protein
MARHNREGNGSDQRGFDYQISYQPDWLYLIKVTRTLESGRQSTKTLFRNPGYREQSPGARVRTHIISGEQGLDFEVVVNDPREVVRRITVETVLPGTRSANDDDDMIIFTLEDKLPPPPPPDDPNGEP